MAFRVAYHPEAFTGSQSLGRKRPRVEDGKHLRFVRSLPCCACGTRANIQAAHIRMASPIHGKRDTGIAQKADDRWTLPLCAKDHEDQHRGSEIEFWNRYGIDPFGLALALWGCTGDEESAEHVIKHAKKETVA